MRKVTPNAGWTVLPRAGLLLDIRTRLTKSPRAVKVGSRDGKRRNPRDAGVVLKRTVSSNASFLSDFGFQVRFATVAEQFEIVVARAAEALQIPEHQECFALSCVRAIQESFLHGLNLIVRE